MPPLPSPQLPTVYRQIEGSKLAAVLKADVPVRMLSSITLHPWKQEGYEPLRPRLLSQALTRSIPRGVLMRASSSPKAGVIRDPKRECSRRVRARPRTEVSVQRSGSRDAASKPARSKDRRDAAPAKTKRSPGWCGGDVPPANAARIAETASR
jgi:hypothetical protein